MAQQQRRHKNQIEINACWDEAIRKEKLNSRINENFTLNPRNCKHYLVVLVAEKPNRRLYESGIDPDSLDLDAATKTTLSQLTAVPKEKVAFPQTSSQELGWDSDLMHFHPTWSHTKSMCAETKYAASYCHMTGRSPYSSKGEGSGPAK